MEHKKVQAQTAFSATLTDEVLSDSTAGSDLEPVQTSSTQAKKHATLRRRLVMFSLCLTLFLAALDTTIVSTALPTIASTLGASTAQ